MRYYIGITSNIEKRLVSHNAGLSKKAWTRRAKDWEIIYTEAFSSKNEALIREREVKNYKGGNAFKKLLTTKMPR